MTEAFRGIKPNRPSPAVRTRAIHTLPKASSHCSLPTHCSGRFHERRTAPPHPRARLSAAHLFWQGAGSAGILVKATSSCSCSGMEAAVKDAPRELRDGMELVGEGGRGQPVNRSASRTQGVHTEERRGGEGAAQQSEHGSAELSTAWACILPGFAAQLRMGHGRQAVRRRAV